MSAVLSTCTARTSHNNGGPAGDTPVTRPPGAVPPPTSETASSCDNTDLSAEIYAVVRRWAPGPARLDPDRTHRYSESRLLSEHAPECPFALPLADAHGQFRLLAFDFDIARGDAPAHAAAFAALLDYLGIPHLVCASSGIDNGGRHIWIRLGKAAPPSVITEIARSARTAFPSLDISPLLNPRTGCVRAPGSRHSKATAARSQVLPSADPLAAVRAADRGIPSLHQTRLLDDLRAMLPAPEDTPTAPRRRRRPLRPSRIRHTAPTFHHGTVADDPRGRGLEGLPRTKRPLSPRIARLLTDPLPSHVDRSFVAARILAGMIGAGWTLADIAHAAFTETLPGLEHFRTVRTPVGFLPRPRHHTYLARHVAYAADYVRTHPLATTTPSCASDKAGTGRPFARARQALLEVVDAADRAEFFHGGTDAAARRLVFDGLVALMFEIGARTVALDVRRWADRIGSHRSTVCRYLAQLITAGWVIRVQPAAGQKAASYSVAIPQFISGTQVTTPPPGPHSPLQATRLRLSHARSDLWSSPALSSLSREAHLQLLLHPGATPRDLAAHLHASATQTLRCLRVLRRAGLVTGSARRLRARASRALFTRTAEILGVAGILAHRWHSYQHERVVWRWWLEELHWRRAPASKKPPWVLRRTYGAFPTTADRRLDWVTAFRRVLAGAYRHWAATMNPLPTKTRRSTTAP
ncbi:hypothetical protein Rruber_05137 (plasmid) [Rhodococcus ruber]